MIIIFSSFVDVLFICWFIKLFANTSPLDERISDIGFTPRWNWGILADVFSSRLDLLLRNATNSGCFNFMSIYVHKSPSSVFRLLSRKDGGHTRVKNLSFIKTHPVPYNEYGKRNSTSAINDTCIWSKQEPSRRFENDLVFFLSSQIWYHYFFLYKRVFATIFSLP